MAEDRTEVPGKHHDQTMEFHLDEATKKKVIECIQKHGKITVIMKEKGGLSLGQDGNGNGKLID
jgi:hypothetical protein